MIALFKRGIKLYFRDKPSLFFSLLGVLILFVLSFVLESGNLDLFYRQFPGLVEKDAKILLTSLMVGGMLASSSITTSLGAYSLMVSDKENKCIKDFNTSPISKKSIIAGYMSTGFVISVIMTLIIFFVGEIIIIIRGGSFVSAANFFAILGITLLASLASSAIVCFIVSLLNTMNSYVIISLLIGTLIGFLVGSYVMVGSSEAFGWIIKCFPCAHAAALFRQFIMQDAILVLPAEVRAGFKQFTGVEFEYNGWVPEQWFYIVILVTTAVIFYFLAILVISKKRKSY